MTDDLTVQQEQFCQEYLIDLNATQAATRAGYSAKTANQQGSRLLANVKVQARIAELKAARAERTGITADLVLGQLLEIATANPADLIQWRVGACPSCWSGADEGDAVSPRAREIDPGCSSCAGEGVGRSYVPDTRTLSGPARRLYAGVKDTKEGPTVNMRNQDKALELLGDHLGLFKKLQVSGPGGGPIETRELTAAAAKLPREKRDALRAAIASVMKTPPTPAETEELPDEHA